MTNRLAIVGMGKMGKAIAALAVERGWEVVARLDVAEMRAGLTRESMNGADVAVEFTIPEAAVGNIRQIVAAGVPVVVGTTGWHAERDEVATWVRGQGGAMLTASNFSVGVNVFRHIVANAARLLAGTGFDAHLIEAHHSAKKDAPSGTAITLADEAKPGWGSDIPITSVRSGSIPGTHEFLFDAPFETIRLAHVARDRRVFAEGALVAAKWLIGRTGVFTMDDVLQRNHE
jgi:4-hydroxy-tetrahydrodipicolinate reductase